jgi:hypothetical protein
LTEYMPAFWRDDSQRGGDRNYGYHTSLERTNRSRLLGDFRTVSFALRRLTKAKLCHKTPNLQDMRQPIYHANIKRVAALEKQIEQARIQARAHFRSM